MRLRHFLGEYLIFNCARATPRKIYYVTAEFFRCCEIREMLESEETKIKYMPMLSVLNMYYARKRDTCISFLSQQRAVMTKFHAAMIRVTDRNSPFKSRIDFKINKSKMFSGRKLHIFFVLQLPTD